MPIVSRLAAMTSRAWGQFKTGAISLTGNYLYFWGANTSSRLGNGLVTATVARSSPIAVAINKTIVTGDAASNTMVIDSSGQLWAWGPSPQALGIGITTGGRSSPTQVGALTDWAKVQCGPTWCYAVKTDGTYWGWGTNANGLLGTSNTTTYSSPVQIGADTNWSEVNGRNQTTVAIKTNGTIWAWGVNSTGQIGDGTTVNKSSPVQIGTLTNWYQASCATNTGAVKTDGTLWVWGRADSGQLGNGTTTPNRSSPIQLGTLTNWAQISAGAQYFVAVKTDGTLWSWGVNNTGQLGDGTTVSKSSPVQIGTLTNWAYVDAFSDQAVARKTDGTIWVWGSQAGTQFGTGDNTTYSSPVQVGTRTDYTFAAMGGSSSLYLTSDGFTWQGGCSGGSSGQVGQANFSTPQALSTLTRKYASAAGLVSSVSAVSTDGKLWSWGGNNNGEIGDGTTIARSLPTQIGTLTNWASVGALSASTPVAVKQDGTLWAWGANDTAQLGNNTWGSVGTAQVPTPFTSNTYSDFSAGQGSLFISNGALYGAGNNFYGQVGDGTTVWRSSPVQIGTQTNWSKVSSGRDFSLALKTDGTLWAWGNNAGYVQGPITPTNSNTAAFSSPVLIALSYEKLPKNGSGSDRGAAAISINNYLVAWGRNIYGEVGDGTTTKVTGPKIIGTLTWSEVSQGSEFTTAIRSDNTLWTWGYNGFGQLGQGDTTNRSSPVQVGTLSDYSTVTAGYAETFFIRNGTLWAVGRNNAGQLGDGTTVDKSSPIQIGTLNTWSSVFTTSLYSAFAIKTDGTLWSWGSNQYGQLGDGTTISKSSPIQIGTLTGWANVSNGGSGAVAVRTNGTLWAWGDNFFGQLGDGTTVSKSSPVQIGTLTNWSRGSLGQTHALATKTDGTVWVWGGNANGELGLGNLTNRSSPVQLGTLTNWSGAVASVTKSFFLNTSKEIWACGNNAVGEGIPPYAGLGAASPAPVSIPVQVGTVTTWSDISGSYDYSLLRRTNNSLWSAGTNTSGQLGQGDTTDNYYIRQVGTLTNWSQISGANAASYARKTDGTIWAWGSNTWGNLGQSNTTPYSSPVQIGTLTNWSYIKVGNQSVTVSAVKTDGTLWSWGRGSDGQTGLGDTIDRSSPTQVGTLTNWAYSYNASQLSMFVKTDNTLWACGQGTGGSAVGDAGGVSRSSPVQIGTGYSGLMAGTYVNNGCYLAQKTDNTIVGWGYGYTGPSDVSNTAPAYIYLIGTSSPVQIGALSNWSSNANQFNRVKTDGTLWGWGSNSNGQIGTGDTADRLSPTQVGTLNTWSVVQTLSGVTAGIRTNGTLWTWGSGGSGALGSGSTASRSSPVQVGTLTNWSKIAVQGARTLAIKTDGTLWAWGANTNGVLGDGTTTNRSSPVQIGTLTNWVDIATGATSNSYAVRNDGTLWAWGLGTSGQLGDGTTISKSSPVQVGTLTTWAGAESTISTFAGAASTV